jgi:hypothetical protein
MAIGNNMVIPHIDYRKIADAETYYTNKGYSYMSVPWIVTFEAYKVTSPHDVRQFHTLDGYLNASGEQSFIQLMLEGKKLTKHMTITPCFRDEPVVDDIRYPYFLKVELIDTDATEDNLHKMITDAKSFLEQYISVEVIATNDDETTFDICDKEFGIELGSYGIRNYKDFKWVYGTGIALPRLDVVLQKL